jgi:hypothetical protein
VQAISPFNQPSKAWPVILTTVTEYDLGSMPRWRYAARRMEYLN